VKRDIDFKILFEREKLDEGELRNNISGYRAFLSSKFQECISQSQPENPIKSSLDAHFEKTLDFFSPLFSKADMLALRYQRLYHRCTISIICLSALAVIVVVSQGLLHLLKNYMYLEAFFMFIILAIIFMGNRTGLNRKWRDYRFLAERLRIATYTALVGFEASRHYKEIRINEISWRAQWTVEFFHDLWDSWIDKNRTSEVTIDDSRYYPVLKAFMLHAWLEGQKNSHARKMKKSNEKHERLSAISSGLFIITLIVALTHWYHPHGIDENLLTFLAVCFPICASAATALREHFELNKIARRSYKMTSIIDKISKKLDETDDRDKVKKICIEAESIFINEISDWHVLVGSHELEAG
jgi:hypothetical protein